jgi:hypothetical protein
VPARLSTTTRGRASGRPSRRPPIDSPWLASELIRSGSFALIGLIGLASCWYGASGTANYEAELPWIVGAVGSLVFSACGMVGWLLAGFREVHHAIDDVLTTIRVENLHQTIDEPLDALAVAYAYQTPREPVTIASGYVTNGSMTRVHRHECPHVHGRAVEQIEVEEIERRGLTYCGVCCI